MSESELQRSKTGRNAPALSMLENTRRDFLGGCGVCLGSIGLAGLLSDSTIANDAPSSPRDHELSGESQTKALDRPRAKSVIYLFMAGGPSQLELFDHKPELTRLSGETPPASFMDGRRFAFLKGNETLLGPTRRFSQYGQSGATISELLPHHQAIVDDICILRGMQTDVFNHGPAKLFMQTGAPQPGRPSIGSWVTYGIGSDSKNLPGFVVLQSGPRGPRAGSALWSSGFLPTSYQGVPFRGQGDPILHLTTPTGIHQQTQQDYIQALGDLNRVHAESAADPEIMTRIASYELAYQMQMSAPELMDLSQETQQTMEHYGASVDQPSFARNAILARRLVERGVRFVQLYHTSWDQHGGAESLDEELPLRCRQVDQATAALVQDLKQRGMLEDTLVIWGGEFGRTPMGEERSPTGRDHHVDAYTMWMAGGGIKPGITHGATDELGFSVVEGAVHVHDLQATILHQLGIDHERLTYRFQGRDFRLTDVHGRVVQEILS